jgi:hypothetical protein
MDMEIFIEPEEAYIQSNSSLTHSGTITLDNRGNMSQEPTFVIEVNDALTSFTITNVTTGISATVPSTTLSAGISLTVYNDSIYRNSGSTLTEISATFTGVFNLKENVSNTISFSLTPSVATSINVDTTWIKPNGNAVSQHYVEGFSINENITQIRKKSNILNKTTTGFIDQEIDYDFSIDKLYQDKQIIDIDKTKSYRITYKTDPNIGAILPITHHLSGCKFNGYSISQASTQQTDAIKENIKGKGCNLFEG